MSPDFVPPSGQRPEDFLTVTDSLGASISLERDLDGVVTAWIARPGENDGYPVLLGEVACERVAAFLLGGPA